MKKQIKRHVVKAKQAISTPEFFKILTLRTIGNFLVLSSLFMIVKIFYQPVAEEVKYFFEKSSGKEYVLPGDEYKIPKGRLAELLKNKKIEFIIPKDAQFGIVIPKIAANAAVVANVNAADQKAYLASLKKGVAHAYGTSFPGEGGHIYLFAHSTDYFWNVGTYNAIFYLLYKLEKNDEVDLFYAGRRYKYTIVDKKIVAADQVQYLTRKTPGEFLTLQTCWPPGTTLKRLLIFAKRVVE